MRCRVLHVFFMSLVLYLPWVKGGDPSRERAILNRLLNSTYDATIRPEAAEGKATQVLVDMTLTSLGPVNDIHMEFSASFLLRQEWRDPRLKYDDLNKSIVIGEKRLDSLWVPDLYFPNSKRASRHEITIPNILILLSPDGTILYSQRLSVTLECPMNFINFPMDKQTCHIDMESYSYTSTDLYYEFSTERDAVERRPGLQIPDFLITDVTLGTCQNKYVTGAYTCLRADVSIEREIGFYATQTYIPSILIVVLSWASFWIDHEAVPARISVGLLTVLTITTQSSGARAQLPRVPYVKAIDVWMSACLVFVFAAYMEYAVVTVMFRRHKKVLKQDDSIYKWGWPKVYLCWRGVVAVYHVAMIILSGLTDRYNWTRTEEDSVKWFIYLTNWMFFLLTLCTIIEFVAVGYCHLIRKDIIKGEVNRMPLFLKVTWVWQNLGNTVSVLVSILFWGLLYSPGSDISNVDYITHAGNTIYVIINLSITASPVRFLHFFHPFIVAVTFAIFSAVYQAAGGTNGLGYSAIYSVLDWSSDPGSAAMYACICSFIGVPFIQFVILLISMLRGTLFDIILGRSRHSGADPVGMDNGIDLTKRSHNNEDVV
ncbi:glycine receptor subunit alpha-4-like [Haliotis cracherodii]|uniref:glycine receptor subunit alpha-4-like n=1 Tax=Haliotis cracherodii TaxID=6455 RepID=UPI0039EB182C